MAAGNANDSAQFGGDHCDQNPGKYFVPRTFPALASPGPAPPRRRPTCGERSYFGSLQQLATVEIEAPFVRY